MDESEIIRNIHLLPVREQKEILKLLDRIEAAREKEYAREHFLGFVKKLWPDFIEGYHHKVIAALFDDIVAGKKKRVIINMPPRHSKSEFASVFLPAYFLGRFPNKKVIQTSHTAELAVGFGRRVKRLFTGNDFSGLFPDVTLSADSKAAGRWATNRGGEYFAIGVGGAVAGKGADLFIIDDPLSEQDQIIGESNPEVYNKVMEWYEGGPRQRLQPGAAIVIVMCVAEGQRVLMGDGTWKEIESVSIGDYVIGYENGLPVRKKVINSINSGIDDVLKIKTRSTELRVNRRHPILVVRGGLKSSARTQEDVVKSRDWNLQWIPAGELSVGDTVVTIKSMDNVGHRPMRYTGQVQMSRDDYWFFGFMFGDGWLATSESRGDVGVCIAKSDKHDLNSEVLDIYEDMFGKRPVETAYGYYRSDDCSAAKWLREKGFSSGARTKRIPDWVFKLRPCDKRQFLRGFFAADGWKRPSVRNAETFTVCLCNRELLDDLRLIARTCGVRVSKIYSHEFDAHAPNSPIPTKAVNYSCRFTMKNGKTELRGRYRNQEALGRHFRMEDVESIEMDGTATVYDLTVEGAESFVAEGVVVHNTRWHQRDLTGQLIRKQINEPGSDEWEVIELPAILPSGQPIWPEFWSLEELLKTKASIPVSKWNAQYQQHPTAEEGALIKRDYWNDWEDEKPPQVDAVIQSWDTAFSKGTRADYSACTTWGVFFNEETGKNSIILLDAIRGKWEFPELKQKALEHYKEWQPDICLIEARAAGMPLIYELRQMGIPIQDVVVGRGGKYSPNDKISRVNGVTDIFASGTVYAPKVKSWAQEVIEECAAFPAGEHDDYVDTVVMAMTRYRHGGWLNLTLDDNEDDYEQQRQIQYY